ncbi:hypothetical protein RHIZ_08760 [Rhizobium skierniewicense]|uniref:hypothetical protein n=1 Tax=Rhizobium TaxID=379 RepID=UPI00177C3C02|nr:MULTISPECIES: hypothetical protein [Rhizobium]MBD8685496.1 hypothetical protein [Rhizobium sp. CFBP 13644]MBD8690831.1 hypothetical protein [Rhizobium sp. CFBP 13717]MCI9866029.1 hypothetical protein [Rhizobium skierniewicense]
MHLTDEVETALAAFAQENRIDRDEAIQRVLRDWLLREGFLFSGEQGIPPHKLNASNDD